MKEETDTNLEQIEAIKIEISLTKEMISKQEELIQALKGDYFGSKSTTGGI